jgi:REP element-mobilizing transposase RayT
MYLELVNRYKSQHKFRLYAYTLLPERLHLLVEPGDDATISQIMHDLNSSYTKYFNGKNARRGHLFESRFKSALVEKAKYLVEATRHVHRQAPVEGAVSSLDLYVFQEEGKAGAPPTVSMEEETREALAFLKNRNNLLSYKRYTLDAASGEAADLEKAFRRASVIGTSEFMGRAQNRIKEHAEIRKEEMGATSAKPNRLVVFILGALILLAVGNSIYLYVSRQKMEAQYDELVRQMESKSSTPLDEVPGQLGGGK